MSAASQPSLRRAARCLPVLAWMGVIYRLSALPGSAVPGRFGSVGHFLLYAVLGVLVYAAARDSGPERAAAAAIVLASLYGLTDEFHQAFVPGRTPDVMDWAVDTVGATTAAILLLWGARRRAGSRQPR